MLYFRPTKFLILLVSLLIGGAVPYAQETEPYAATLTIVYADVAVRRAQTEAWIPLRVGAVMPLGAGDQVRTGASGRALIEFWPGAHMLLLPYSTYEQGMLNTADMGNQLAASLSGAAIHQFIEPAADYRLELDYGVVSQAGGQFATWSLADVPDAVTVYEGEAVIDLEGTRITIDEQQGWQAGKNPVRLDGPLNAAALTAFHQDECAGTVNIVERELRVRAGPGPGYVAMGSFADGDRVTVLGINESNGWYRVRLDSHFGWVEALAVVTETGCDDLPRFADDTAELFLQAVDASDLERIWLRPYFGLPLEDPWFYRSSLVGS